MDTDVAMEIDGADGDENDSDDKIARWNINPASLVVLQKPSEARLGDGDKGGWADSAVVTTAGVTSSAPRTQLARFQ